MGLFIWLLLSGFLLGAASIKEPSTAPIPPSAAAPRLTAFGDSDGYELFAIVGGSECATSLYYGPSPISLTGSADGHTHYISTASKMPHSEWLQIVTSNGVNEIYRIYWTFNDYQTLAQRFIDAVRVGHYVEYRVVDKAGWSGLFTSATKWPGATVTYYYIIWRFSSAANITANTFAVSKSTKGFSAHGGLWGAGYNRVDTAYSPSRNGFWGTGNYDGSSQEAWSCKQIRMLGKLFPSDAPFKLYPEDYPNSRSFMFFKIPDPTIASTPAPSRVPSRAPSPAPSLAPSAPVPTIHPSTASPTTQDQKIMWINQQLVLSSVASSTLSEGAQQAIVQTVALSIAVDPSLVKFIGFSASSTALQNVEMTAKPDDDRFD